jgi:NMD protein affecting ribosome stability and mRNA decay
MREELGFSEVDESHGAWCPRCGEWEQGLDLLIDCMCPDCEAEQRKFFNDD